MQRKPYKSSLHASLDMEDHANERARTAREIARVLSAPPITRRPRASLLVRLLRAIWRAL